MADKFPDFIGQDSSKDDGRVVVPGLPSGSLDIDIAGKLLGKLRMANPSQWGKMLAEIYTEDVPVTTRKPRKPRAE